MPNVETIDAFWEMKRTGQAGVAPDYEPIEMPRNTPTGVITAFFAVMLGFAAIWHIWWLVIIGLLAVVVTAAVFGWSEYREFELPAAEVARMDRPRLSPGTAA